MKVTRRELRRLIEQAVQVIEKQDMSDENTENEKEEKIDLMKLTGGFKD